MVNYTVIEILLNGSNKNDLEKKEIIDRIIFIETNWNEFTELEYYQIVNNLKLNQLDPIAYGLNYNQTALKKHLSKIL